MNRIAMNFANKFEQLNLFDLLNESGVVGSDLSSEELERAIEKLKNWQARAKKREQEEKEKREREEQERLARETQAQKDAHVREVTSMDLPMDWENAFRSDERAGGGGTDFQIIFEYVDQYMREKPPASIIILTDGYAPFPKEELANDIPVLWLINNNDVTPPWGKIARIAVCPDHGRKEE